MSKNCDKIREIRAESVFFPAETLRPLEQTYELIETLTARRCLMAFFNYIKLVIQANDLCFSYLNESRAHYRFNLESIRKNFA